MKAKKKAAHQADLRLQLLGGPERFKYAINFVMFRAETHSFLLRFFL